MRIMTKRRRMILKCKRIFSNPQLSLLLSVVSVFLKKKLLENKLKGLLMRKCSSMTNGLKIHQISQESEPSSNNTWSAEAAAGGFNEHLHLHPLGRQQGGVLPRHWFVEEIEETTPRQPPTSVMDWCFDIFFINLSPIYRIANYEPSEHGQVIYQIFHRGISWGQKFCNVFCRMWSNRCTHREGGLTQKCKAQSSTLGTVKELNYKCRLQKYSAMISLLKSLSTLIVTWLILWLTCRTELGDNLHQTKWTLCRAAAPHGET